MKRSGYYLFLLLVPFFIVCDVNTTKDEEPELEELILGRWDSGNTIRHYAPDGTYKDTVYSEHPPMDTVEGSECRQMINDSTYIQQVIEGEYSVQDSIIQLTPKTIPVYCISVFKVHINRMYPMLAEFVQDTLQLAALRSFERISGSAQDIYGEWSSSNPAMIFNPEYDDKYITDSITDRFTFPDDSSHFHQLTDAPYDYYGSKSSYYYVHPEFSINQGAYSITWLVSFDSDMMRWRKEYGERYTRRD